MACSWGPSPSTRQVPGSSPGPGGRAARAFSLHPPFLPPSGDSFFLHLPHQTHESVRVIKIQETCQSKCHHSSNKYLRVQWGYRGFYVTSYQANFASHHIRNCNVSFLSPLSPSNLPHQTHESVRVIKIQETCQSKCHHSSNKYLRVQWGYRVFFFVTLYQANFASHHIRDCSVSFLSPQSCIGKHNKMSQNFPFS